MKNIAILLIGFCAMPLCAREQTLFSGTMDHGGYGGPVVKFSQIGPNQDVGVLVGGQGGWIINHSFVVGGGGYGLTNDVNADWYDIRTYDGEPQPYVLDFGYGGLLLAFISNSDDLIHYEVFGLFGGGGANYRLKNQVPHNNNDSDGLFVAEPGANIMLNVTPYFRIGVGGSYRYVQGVDLVGLDDGDLSGMSGHIVFKFGAF